MYNSCQGDSARRQRYHMNTALILLNKKCIISP